MSKINSPENIDVALTVLQREFFMQVVSLLSMDENHKELTLNKVPITLENGGIYLLSLIHVDGPKINLDEIRKGAVLQPDKKENPT